MSFKAFSFLYNTASRQKIAKDVADPEQRHYLVEAQIRHGIPLQLRAMREGQGWTQATLAEKLGTTQNAISRLENPRTGKPTITTLERIAQAFDVALIVKFAPFSELIDSLSELSEKSVSVPSYEYEEKEKETKAETLGCLWRNIGTAQAMTVTEWNAYYAGNEGMTYNVTEQVKGNKGNIIDISLYQGNSVALNARSFYVEPKRA